MLHFAAKKVWNYWNVNLRLLHVPAVVVGRVAQSV
jgi:hypothetical protein